MKSLVLVVSLFALSSNIEPEVLDDPEPLALLFEKYCLQPDGDHRMTWQKAESDGYELLNAEEFSGLRLLGSHGSTIRAFRKLSSNTETRILTASSWIQGPDEGRSYFRYCWVSRTNEQINEVNRDLNRQLAGRYFRAEKTFVYAWIPRPDGTNEFVPRRIYMRSQLRLAREQGMRQVTARQYGDSVFVGYSSPRDEATYRDFDWSGPDPVPRPE